MVGRSDRQIAPRANGQPLMKKNRRDFTQQDAYASSRQKIVAFVSGLKLSIRQKIAYSFLAVIFMMSLLNLVFMIQTLAYQRQYDAIMDNIATANSLNGYVSSSINTEMWRVITGKVSFDEGRQYEIIGDVNRQVDLMMQNTDSRRGRLKLDVIQRTMNTLRRDIDKVGVLVKGGARTEIIREELNEVFWVAGLVEDNVQDYMLFETLRSEQQYTQIQSNFRQWIIINIAVLCGVLLFSASAAWVISESIYIPIKKLHDVTSTIAHNDLEALLRGEHADEITELGMTFNIMIQQINQLLENKIKEQEALKKAELRALQAQIAPHFFYNTLDTIVWLAEMGKTQQVIDMVKALSDFFRIGLSKGEDWITLREEVRHTRSYLTIQQMRYHDILDFEIDVDKEILDSQILKLTLQPLVENALYHGIKQSRKGGKIVVRGEKRDEETIYLEVSDNGIGFKPERLAQILAEISDDSIPPHVKDSGFGLDNVNKRIRLYYGRQYGLNISSQQGNGTRVSLTIPIMLGSASTQEAK